MTLFDRDPDDDWVNPLVLEVQKLKNELYCLKKNLSLHEYIHKKYINKELYLVYKALIINEPINYKNTIYWATPIRYINSYEELLPLLRYRIRENIKYIALPLKFYIDDGEKEDLLYIISNKTEITIEKNYHDIITKEEIGGSIMFIIDIDDEFKSDIRL